MKKNGPVVWKTTWGIWQILTWALKIGTQNWDFYGVTPSRKCMSLKFTRELCVMTMKKDAKFEKELTSSNFDSSIQKSQKFAL